METYIFIGIVVLIQIVALIMVLKGLDDERN